MTGDPGDVGRALYRALARKTDGADPDAHDLATIVDGLEGADHDKAQRLLAGALDHAVAHLDTVQLVVTGLAWLGSGVRSVEATLVEMIKAARSEIAITAYSVTDGGSAVLDAIMRAVGIGIRCTIIVDGSCADNPRVVELLSNCQERYPKHFRGYRFVNTDMGALHAKVVVVDRRSALVGSANLSHLGLVRSHELALLLRGPTASLIADRLDLLAASTYVTSTSG